MFAPNSDRTIAHRLAPVAGATTLGLLVACNQSGDASIASADSTLRCAGTAITCTSLSAEQCAHAEGCTPGLCAGTPDPCEAATQKLACGIEQGCRWNDQSSACEGKPSPCGYFSGANCPSQLGCWWVEGCAGSPASCGALDETACSLQPGCYVSSGPGAEPKADGGDDAAGRIDCSHPPAREDIIDDMEDQSPQISSSGDFGHWFTFTDVSAGQLVPAPGSPFEMMMIPGGRCASEYAMRIYGSGFAISGAGMGFDFGYEPPLPDGTFPYDPFDATIYEGIRFWARAGTDTDPNIGVVILNADTEPSGGRCTKLVYAGPSDMPSEDASDAADLPGRDSERDASSGADLPDGGDSGPAGAISTADCFDRYTKTLRLTNDWVEYRIAFTDFRQGDWGYQPPSFALDQLYGIRFRPSKGTKFDVWVDDVAWWRAGAP